MKLSEFHVLFNMLSRKKILYRHKIPTNVVNTTWAVKHFLSPSKEMVDKYIGSPSVEAWEEYKKLYLDLIKIRFSNNPLPFERLAKQAIDEDVYLGCYCPTKINPDVYKCHTILALKFMEQHYPDLDVVFPEAESKQLLLFPSD